jgi:hypothetical protein
MRTNTLISIVLGAVLVLVIGFYAFRNSAFLSDIGRPVGVGEGHRVDVRFTHEVIRDVACYDTNSRKTFKLRKGTKVAAYGFTGDGWFVNTGDVLDGSGEVNCKVYSRDMKELLG